jgi:hypothetical protein
MSNQLDQAPVDYPIARDNGFVSMEFARWLSQLQQYIILQSATIENLQADVSMLRNIIEEQSNV